MRPQDYIRNSIKEALAKSGFPIKDRRFLNLEKPKLTRFGDISSPVAMNLAPEAKMPPRKLAEKLVENLHADPSFIEKIEIAGPGFINFFLAEKCLQNSVLEIVREGAGYGRTDYGDNRKVQFEFVSANPTGPLNVVSARAAAIGDVLANLYNETGYSAYREFYVNDAGRQIRLLGTSLSARYMSELGFQEAVPEDGYHGYYLIDLAKELAAEQGRRYADLDSGKRQGSVFRERVRGLSTIQGTGPEWRWIPSPSVMGFP